MHLDPSSYSGSTDFIPFAGPSGIRILEILAAKVKSKDRIPRQKPQVIAKMRGFLGEKSWNENTSSITLLRLAVLFENVGLLYGKG
ncbi:hypothetical protein Y032_0282g1292 [Ancylostoma ceylanicum]|uniref:Uncharacterized protein n=1 Tax=Ancylostoma ceylanicum TaxID=53326 RepID=A0A016S6I8_9BILA|nr:hypothetical protein Y032_0282g1292 [Ancylostoma ceylanicum]